MRPCTVIDAPSHLGLRPTGIDGLPDALRAVGLLEGLPDVRYSGRLPVPSYDFERDEQTGVLNAEGIARFDLLLADRVGSTLDDGRFPLVLGGDCSILLGPALALRRRGRYGLFFIDGHADFYSPETEPSGEVASMDLAIVTGRGPAVLADLDGMRPLFRDEDVVLFGYRDAEQAAEHGSPDVRATGVRSRDLSAVRAEGVTAAARASLDALRAGGVDGVWIHLDADVLHDEVMPAVDYRMADGLWPEELNAVLTAILASPLAVGMDITIYNPNLDTTDRAAGRVLAEIVNSALAAA